MTLKDKALENLEAGQWLLDRGRPNAAASRLYYSMYQAAVHRLTVKGVTPGQRRSGAVRWDHSMVENNSGFLRNSFEDRMLYREMRNMRTTADYKTDSVSAPRLRVLRAAIADYVKEVTA